MTNYSKYLLLFYLDIGKDFDDLLKKIDSLEAVSLFYLDEEKINYISKNFPSKIGFENKGEGSCIYLSNNKKRKILEENLKNDILEKFNICRYINDSVANINTKEFDKKHLKLYLNTFRLIKHIIQLIKDLKIGWKEWLETGSRGRIYYEYLKENDPDFPFEEIVKNKGYDDFYLYYLYKKDVKSHIYNIYDKEKDAKIKELLFKLFCYDKVFIHEAIIKNHEIDSRLLIDIVEKSGFNLYEYYKENILRFVKLFSIRKILQNLLLIQPNREIFENIAFFDIEDINKLFLPYYNIRKEDAIFDGIEIKIYDELRYIDDGYCFSFSNSPGEELGEKEDYCPICLENKINFKTGCGHVFHLHCLFLFQNTTECCLCKQNIDGSKDENKEEEEEEDD